MRSFDRSADGELVLGVDGGNTKTDLALLDSGGRLLALVRGGGSSPHYVGVEGCLELLENLTGAALERAGLGPPTRPFAAAAQVLLAGADLPEEISALRARIDALRWSERLAVGNDTQALLRAGTDRGWGLAVVCGTGINCLGRAPDGREITFPSLGEITGDWGGGTDLGLAALAAASRGADGRGRRTVLERVVPAQFGLVEPLDVSRALHLRQLTLARLGELAPVVLAASAEDPVAAGIVQRLAGEVIAFAEAALRRLGLERAEPDVVLGGGVLKALPASVIQTIDGAVTGVAPGARVLVSASEPIVGAALLALDALGADQTARERARAELDEAARSRAQGEPASH